MKEKLENLIPISITDESDVYVSARDLHDFLEVKTNFRLWYPKMIDYGFLENEDYQIVYEKTGSFYKGQRVVDYMMTTDMAKEISIIQQSEKGRQARLYFLGVEKKIKSAQIALRSLLQMTESNFRNSTTFARPDSIKEESIKEEIIEKEVTYDIVSVDEDVMVDKDEVYENEAYEIVDRKSTLKTNFRDTSKLLGIRENLFVNWLLLNNYCYRDKNGTIKPYARVMDYFYMREFVTEKGHSGMQTMVSPRGREFFRNVLIDEKIIKEEVKLFK